MLSAAPLVTTSLCRRIACARIFYALLVRSAIVGAAAESSQRGVVPDDAQRYIEAEEGGVFHCFDGSEPVFSAEKLNDNFCDCNDGSDEPGTSACGDRGRFFCQNTGSFPQWLVSRHVDDGVCDCCDGSDEPAGHCSNTCPDEADFIAGRFVKLLGDEWIGEERRAAAVKGLPTKYKTLKTELAEVTEKRKVYVDQRQEKMKKLQNIYKKVAEEAKNKKGSSESPGEGSLFSSLKNSVMGALAGEKKEDESPPVPQDAVAKSRLTCFFTETAIEAGMGHNKTQGINASCIQDQACIKVCTYACPDSRKFNGSCLVETGDVGADEEPVSEMFEYNPDGLMMQMYMARARGEDPDGVSFSFELGVVKYFVPEDGDSDAEKEFLEAKQELAMVVEEMTPFERRYEELKDAPQRLKKLVKSGNLGQGGAYSDLFDICVNASISQFVGSTAVEEQWRTFFYDICFFSYATQHEVREDEAGQPKKTLLGTAAGFLNPAKPPSAMQIGFDRVFFDITNHTLVYPQGEGCQGGIRRLLAVQFSCGAEASIKRVEERITCGYVAEVIHPAPCNLTRWPEPLPQFANESAGDLSQLESKLRTWINEGGQALMKSRRPGRINWNVVLKTADSAIGFLMNSDETDDSAGDDKSGICVDSEEWQDSDGEGCDVYAEHISNNRLSQEEACAYNDGAAQIHCPYTCGTCDDAETKPVIDNDYDPDLDDQDKDEKAEEKKEEKTDDGNEDKSDKSEL